MRRLRIMRIESKRTRNNDMAVICRLPNQWNCLNRAHINNNCINYGLCCCAYSTAVRNEIYLKAKTGTVVAWDELTMKALGWIHPAAICVHLMLWCWSPERDLVSREFWDASRRRSYISRGSFYRPRWTPARTMCATSCTPSDIWNSMSELAFPHSSMLKEVLLQDSLLNIPWTLKTFPVNKNVDSFQFWKPLSSFESIHRLLNEVNRNKDAKRFVGNPLFQTNSKQKGGLKEEMECVQFTSSILPTNIKCT